MKKIICLTLALVMMLAMGIEAFAADFEGVTFAYNYDVQRNPAFPKKGDSVTLWNFTYPIDENGYHGATSEGAWSLTPADVAPSSSEKLENVTGNVATEYGIDVSEIVIHELKDGDKHIAYGVVISYDATEELVFFIGDTLLGGAGYVLSKIARSEEITTTVTIDAKDIVEENTDPEPTPDPEPAPIPESEPDEIVIDITGNNAAKEGEENPNTGAPVFAPAVIVLAALALIRRK